MTNKKETATVSTREATHEKVIFKSLKGEVKTIKLDKNDIKTNKLLFVAKPPLRFAGFSRDTGYTNLGNSPSSSLGQDEPGKGFGGKRDEMNTRGSRDQVS